MLYKVRTTSSVMKLLCPVHFDVRTLGCPLLSFEDDKGESLRSIDPKRMM